jgi:thiamine biosynthesis protein ThiS
MVTINGKQEQAVGMSILAYLQSAGYSPDKVVVEKNLEIIPRDRLDEVVLENGQPGDPALRGRRLKPQNGNHKRRTGPGF